MPRIPACWGDFHFPLRLEVRRVRPDVIERCRTFQAQAVRPTIHGAQHEVFKFRYVDHRAEQLLKFRLVGDERFAPDTQAAGFTQQDQAEAIDMNDQ